MKTRNGPLHTIFSPPPLHSLLPPLPFLPPFPQVQGLRHSCYGLSHANCRPPRTQKPQPSHKQDQWALHAPSSEQKLPQDVAAVAAVHKSTPRYTPPTALAHGILSSPSDSLSAPILESQHPQLERHNHGTVHKTPWMPGQPSNCQQRAPSHLEPSSSHSTPS